MGPIFFQMSPRLAFTLLLVLACTVPAFGQGKSDNAPGNSGSAPGHSGSAPGHSDNAPGNSGSAPGNSGDSPGNSTNAPGNGGSGPGNSGTTSGTTGCEQAGNAPGQGIGPVGGGPDRNGGPRTSTSPVPPATPDVMTPLSPDQVRDAVDARQAMPLASLGDVIRARGGGEIVDASLLRVDQMLVYAIKVLDPSGRLSVEYFHARSGVYIGSE